MYASFFHLVSLLTRFCAASVVVTSYADDWGAASIFALPAASNIITQNVVSISVSDAVAAETNSGEVMNTASFVVSRTGPTHFALPVLLTLSGTASNGVDYPRISEVLTIPKGAEAAEFKIQPVNDSVPELAETIVVSIQAPLCIAIYPPPPECYQVGPRSEAKATLLDNDSRVNPAPTVTIKSPANGAVFSTGTNLLLIAEAKDADGQIKSVEFYRGSDWIGTGTNNPALSSISPYQYHFRWTNPPAGTFVIQAKATDNSGLVATSEPVKITVAEVAFRAVVNLATADSVAAEKGANNQPKKGVFVISRSGPTNVDLRVYYAITGTASNGVDYVRLNGNQTISKGSTRAEIAVTPIQDQQVEGIETVVMMLKESPCTGMNPPSLECYWIGELKEAKITIHDTLPVTNMAPIVHFNTPTNSAIYVAPADILLWASAYDRDGTIKSVEFYQGATRLGSGIQYDIDSGPFYRLTWSNVVAGQYVLTAKATDNAGLSSVSDPVKIIVAESTARFWVERSLPDTYSPGSAFVVRLAATPANNITVYSVEDQPPQGWPVKEISHEGVYDRITGKVKFGPFFDHTARTYTYQVIPPSTASGTNRFKGSASADGVSSPIGGRDTIVNISYHPADIQPRDLVMSQDEMTAYGMAWKKGKSWPAGPNPIPASYVTRAGSLWRNGERYHYDAKAGSPPLCWVNDPVMRPTVDLFQMSLVNQASVTLPGMLTWTAVNAPLTVRLNINPANGVAAYVVEEQVPTGWLVTDLSHDGVLDAARNLLKWGPFLDGAPRSLAYQITPSAAAAGIACFGGIASFDGVDVPLSSQREWAVNSAGTGTAKMTRINRLPDGTFEVYFTGEIGRTYMVETSNDLVHWTPFKQVVNQQGTWISIISPESGIKGYFYRAKPLAR